MIVISIGMLFANVSGDNTISTCFLAVGGFSVLIGLLFQVRGKLQKLTDKYLWRQQGHEGDPTTLAEQKVVLASERPV